MAQKESLYRRVFSYTPAWYEVQTDVPRGQEIPRLEFPANLFQVAVHSPRAAIHPLKQFNYPPVCDEVRVYAKAIRELFF
jgi:hypothetical protein